MWESIDNINCPSLLEEFEKNLKKNKEELTKSHKRTSYSVQTKDREKKNRKSSDKRKQKKNDSVKQFVSSFIPLNLFQ